jgi:plastocyanin
MKKGVIIGLLAVVVLVGAAAALMMSNDSKSKGDGNTNPTTSSNPSDQEQAVATTSVDIMDMAFSPANITVKKGQTVTWTNKDTVSHTVTGDTSGNINSDTLAEGDTYQFTFNEVGTFAYHCSFHPFTGTVVVTE